MAKSHILSSESQPRRIVVGEILTAHGIKGLVKVRIDAEDVSLLEGGVFTSACDNTLLTLTLKNQIKGAWLAEVEGVADRTRAETLRGTKLYIDRARLPAPLPGEYYHVDLIGAEVADAADGRPLGTVIGVDNFGAGDLLDIRPPQGGQSFYLPFTAQTIRTIAPGKITAVLPEGLLE